MPRGELSTLLSALRRAVRAGRDLSAASPASAASALGLGSVTLSLLTAHAEPELLWADPADVLGPTLDDLQYALGEGPTFEAARTGLTVAVPDLEHAPDRWPAFTPSARATPARAAVAVPLRLGAATIGVLTGYHTEPTPFPPERLRDLDAFARVALDLLIQTPPTALTSTASHAAVDLHRAEVHQAAGMLTVQLNLSIDKALLRLRGHAWAHDRPLLATARDIIAGRLRLGPL